jgi:transcriptional regulator with PAS, ATPase and Fis domain
MSIPDWARELPISITVLDENGVIVEMNQESVATFSAEGGAALIGTNALDCHPEPSRSKLQLLLREARANLYTIEKDGAKKLICQVPWYSHGKFSGLVELSIRLPEALPHFVRD